jgi:hypothetical protein
LPRKLPSLSYAIDLELPKPQTEQPGYALITNGGEFLFIKLLGPAAPVYDFSDTFSLLNRGNDLSKVLTVLKQISASL